jgi:hypothetical protein
MDFSNTQVMNFENSLRGMRNPKESWDRSDSFFGIINEWSDIDYEIAANWVKKEKPEYYEDNLDDYEDERINLEDEYDQWLIKNGILNRGLEDFMEVAFIGPNDMNLAQRLIKAGPEHRKFMRQIFVSVDITAPIYWWKEFDKYQIGVTTNSTSTMHKLASTPITLDCFETDDFNEDLIVFDNEPYNIDSTINDCVEDIVNVCETLRQRYNETKDKRYWKELIRWLPESWLQTRTVTMNYENLLSICNQRSGHKLTEWKSFIDWAKQLPYANELIFINKKND